MALIKLGLTRDQFASFLQDFEQIKQFEKLFTTVDDNTNNEIPSIAINAGNAGEAANDALAQVAALAELLALVDTAPRAELGTLAALQQSNVPSLTFDNAPEVIPTAIGSVYWDGGTTLGVQMTANIVGRVNEDQFYYIKASAAITKGQVIMFDGAVGASGVIKGKPATGVTNGAYIMGIAAESIANNGFGLVQAFGSLRGINTSTFSDGDILWYDPAVTGGLTKTEPVAPNVKVQVAAVTNAANNGSIAIRVTAGSVLGGTDSNVQITSLTDKDMLVYIGANSRWENKDPSAVRTNLGLGTMALQNTGVSGTFTTADTPPKTVTVTNGIITNIV